MNILSKSFTFHSAHILSNHSGKCKNLHGHSYKLIVKVCGDINEETGMIIDFSKINKVVKGHIIDVVDHKYLGKGEIIIDGKEIQPVFKCIPTVENLAKLFFNHLKGIFDYMHIHENIPIKLYSIKLYETKTSFFEYKGDE